MYQVLVTDMNGNVIAAVNETTNPFSLSCLRNMTAVLDIYFLNTSS